MGRVFTKENTTAFASRRPRALSLPPRVRRMGSYGQQALLPHGPPRTGHRAQSCYVSPDKVLSTVYSTIGEDGDEWCSPLPLSSENTEADLADGGLDEWCSGMTEKTVNTTNETGDELMGSWMSESFDQS